MTKFTKITAAIVAAAAVLSFAGCSNNTSSASESSSTVSAASTAEAAKTAEAAATAEADSASTAQAATAEVAAPATAEASAFDVSVMYGEWILAGINNGTETMSVADYAASIGASAEDCMAAVKIDENGYTSATSAAESTLAYTASENGVDVDLGEGNILNVIYDADSDALFYGYADAEGNTYKFIFMRNTDDDAASTAEADAAATAQAAATAEAAE